MDEFNYQMSAYLQGDTPITVALAFECIAAFTKDSNLSEGCFERIYNEFSYLNHQLFINKAQAYILAVVLSKQYTTSSVELCDHAKVSPIFIMSLQPDVDYLIKRGLLALSEDADEDCWIQEFHPTAKLLDAVRFNILPN